MDSHLLSDLLVRATDIIQLKFIYDGSLKSTHYLQMIFYLPSVQYVVLVISLALAHLPPVPSLFYLSSDCLQGTSFYFLLLQMQVVGDAINRIACSSLERWPIFVSAFRILLLTRYLESHFGFAVNNYQLVLTCKRGIVNCTSHLVVMAPQCWQVYGKSTFQCWSELSLLHALMVCTTINELSCIASVFLVKLFCR